MPNYVLSHEAEIDIVGISEYIAERNVTAAIKMLDRIQEACQMLADNPNVGEIRKGFGIPGCRSFTVSRYVVFFRPNSNGIDVARILDASRDLGFLYQNASDNEKDHSRRARTDGPTKAGGSRR